MQDVGFCWWWRCHRDADEYDDYEEDDVDGDVIDDVVDVKDEVVDGEDDDDDGKVTIWWVGAP